MTFNTPLEMQAEKCIFMKVEDVVTFNTPLEMLRLEEVSHKARETHRLSILHWRCGVKIVVAVLSNGKKAFQYSIGDAPLRR